MADLQTQLAQQLATGLEQLQIELSIAQQQQLIAYVQLLDKWNRAYNLTAVRDVEQMVSRHLLDSMAVWPFLPTTGHWLDVGSGGGLPGIPLAIANPEQHWTLLDSNGKKSRFQFQAASELGLRNVSVEQVRLEAYQPAQPFDGIISRAFSSVDQFVHGCADLLQEGASLWAMKGLYPEDELRQIRNRVVVKNRWSLHIPGAEQDAERHLLELVRDV